jgi:hypothetical protein
MARRASGAALLLVLLVGAAGAADDPSPAALVTDASRFVRGTNAERLEVLRALLGERRLAFTVQDVPNARGGRDARPGGQNVIVDIGTGPGDIVIGAHLDAVRLSDGSLSGGVVDNAASVVVLTRVAEALSGARLRHRVRVVFFDLEEAGLIGSTHFVTSVGRDRIAAMVNLDIGAYGDTIVFGPGQAPPSEPVAKLLHQVCARGGHTCLEFARFPVSDDRSFETARIPNVSIATLPRLEAHQLWLMLNGGPNAGLAPGTVPAVLQTIHTPADRPDKLDPAAMLLAYRVILALVMELDAALSPAP